MSNSTRNTQSHFTALDRRYEGNWRQALRDACEAMRTLGRHARWLAREVKASQRSQELYDLRIRFIHRLLELGYSESIYAATTQLANRDCRKCKGSGRIRIGSGREIDCGECDDGQVTVGREIAWIVFVFAVNGRKYTWSIPRANINWPVHTTAEPGPLPNNQSQKESNEEVVTSLIILIEYILAKSG